VELVVALGVDDWLIVLPVELLPEVLSMLFAFVVALPDAADGADPAPLQWSATSVILVT
jgi:hypothetical protein